LHPCDSSQREVLSSIERLSAAQQSQGLLVCKFRNYGRLAALYGNAIAEQLITAGMEVLQAVCTDAAQLTRLDAATVAVVVANALDIRSVEQLAHRCAAHGQSTNTSTQPPLLLTMAISHQLLSRAHLACQRAETRPGNQVSVASDDLNQHGRESYEHEAALHRAIERRELTVHLQPIVRLSDGAPIGFECLSRWQQDGGSLVEPSRYLAQTVEAGISADVDLISLASALDAAPRLAAAAVAAPQQLLLSANISAQLVENPRKVEELLQLLEQHLHTSPVRLQLELLEESLNESDPEIDRLLNTLAAMGVLIAIDDFGTGYSSLSRIHNLAINIIKVDRSFVRRLNDPIKPSNALLTTLMAIGEDLQIDLTAEGIETESQWHWLRDHGCSHGQGFLFGKPLDPDAAVDYLKATVTS